MNQAGLYDVPSNKAAFAGAALAFLERDQFTHSSLLYLEKNVQDEATLRRLAAVTVKPELEVEKLRPIDAARSRSRSKLPRYLTHSRARLLPDLDVQPLDLLIQ